MKYSSLPHNNIHSNSFKLRVTFQQLKLQVKSMHHISAEKEQGPLKAKTNDLKLAKNQ